MKGDHIRLYQGDVKRIEHHHARGVERMVYPDHLRPIRYFVDLHIDSGDLALGQFDTYAAALHLAQAESASWKLPVRDHVGGADG